MKIETYKCDICGARKGETNHWMIVTVSTDNPGSQPQLTIVEFDEEPRNNNDRDVCGVTCLLSMVSGFAEGLCRS